MMNQGESTADTVTSLENHKINDSHQVIAASYSLSNSAIASWNMQGENLSSRENGVLSGSSYNHDQPTEPTLKNVQEGVGSAPIAPSSSTGPANAAQGYSGYAAYQNTDPYGYNAAGYAAYYNQYQQQSTQYQQPPSQYQQQPSQYQQQSNQYQQQSTQYQQQSNQYQQQPTQSYSHHVGTYQNTGAAYQPLSSFQNSGSYAGPPSYSGTYYNPGNYQTSASYKNGTYGTQSNLWHGGQYATYSSHPYPNYTPDSNPAYSSTSAVATSQYAHHYNKQWEDYYNQNQTEVSCAPGTENIAVSTASSLNNLVPSGSGGYAASNSQIPAASNNQMPVAYTPSWRPEPSSSELAPAQPTTITGSNPEVYWKNGASTFPNNLTNTLQPTAQKPLEVLPAYNNFQNQPNPTFSQGSTALYPNSYQASQGQQSSFQTLSQPPEPSDSRRASKLQIQTNPRIASNLPLSVPKDKDSSMTSTAAKPSYISVLMQKTNEKVMSHDEADSMLKPGTFPKSLRGYVERALARCKNDRQKAASQVVLKEVITKATTDGTLYTRDWDTEPLFPMPNTDGDNNQDRFPLPPTVLKNKSPTRRAKSRWEPMSEEKMVDKSANILDRTPKYGGWNNKLFSGGQMQNKDNLGTKSSDNRSFSKNVFRPMKRQRLGDSVNAVDDDETSSDSDAEKILTKHSAAAIALSQSPEEKRRRENRSKRFDRGHGNRAEKARAKDVRPSNLYARRANAMVLSRNFEEIGSRAVEDIDWDSLTIKGTCQEIEKRYLRLTSAPDPATVRPEEVLEKALRMVQTSPKNYLYKCDQLKSIRQDLTVQRIRNELTVKVYETHARMAIEFGDLPEYNQCQSQLKTLYSEGIPGSYMEFAAYNLLCVIMHSNNNRDLLSAMSRLSADAKKNEAVKHALAVHSAVTSGNYVMFFRLYKCAPNLNTFLMDVEKMRYAAVKCISRSYRPTVPVSYISQILGFNHESLRTGEASDEKDVDEWEECVEWLKAHGASVILDSSGETLLDTKASVSTLYMPDPEDAVSHGDANLAVNDFLARNSAQAN